MWNYLYVLYLYINSGKSLSGNHFTSSIKNGEKELDCENGTWLSTSVCIPQGYHKAEVPEIPTVVNAGIEINNIREVNDKKMRLTLDFYLELLWVDNRIRTIVSTNSVSALNINLINSIWKPDLWIKNLFDFKLHSVLEQTGGLMIMDKYDCESVNCTKKGTERSTLVAYNLEAQATIYCNFHFQKYPMDTQYCEFFMDGSYPRPNIVDFSFDLGQFGVTYKNSNIDDFLIEITFNVQSNQTGIHSIIKLERCILPFIIRYYLPGIAIIIVSLISFLISMDSMAARVALLVTQFLTLTNILIAQQVNI